MKLRTLTFVILLWASLSLSACHRNIVKAAPPSVTLPPSPGPIPEPTAPPSSAEEAAETPPPSVTPAPTAPPALRPVEPRPRPPAEAEASKPKTEPEAPPSPPPPQIAPALSPQQLAGAQRRTSNDIVIAERNLQLVTGKRMNATQNDLTEKIRDFLGQAHEAIRSSDWVRAENLAHKAQILSNELAKSF